MSIPDIDWVTCDQFDDLDVEFTTTRENHLFAYEALSFIPDRPTYSVSIPLTLLPSALAERLTAQRVKRGYTTPERPFVSAPARRKTPIPVGPDDQWKTVEALLRKAKALNRPLDHIFIGRQVRVTLSGFTVSDRFFTGLALTPQRVTFISFRATEEALI